MARSYSKVIRGFDRLDDPELLRSFDEFADECTSKGGKVQVKVNRSGDFELTCSILEGGAFEGE